MSAWKRSAESIAERRESRRNSRKRKIALDWAVVPASLLGLFVQLMVRDGRAVLFGTTSDGGTLSLSVYDDGDKERYYIRSGQDVVAELADVLDEYSERAAEEFMDAATPQKAQKGDIVPDAPEKGRKTD